jgi:hypothetical protein
VTVETVLPDGAEDTARLAFIAGYAAAVQHIGTVLAAVEVALQ